MQFKNEQHFRFSRFRARCTNQTKI